MEIVNKRRFILFISVLVILISLITAGSFFVKYQLDIPLTKEEGKEQIFKVRKGEGLKEISEHLEEAGFIRSKFWFTVYVFYKKWSGQLQAGEYTLSPALNIKEIAQKIKKGEVNSSEIKVTIPEGFDLKKIDARLSQLGLIQKGELLQYPELEGYLFPDTYFFDKNAGVEEIIKKMRDNFEIHLKEFKGEIEKQRKTLKEIIIMASLLEKEVPTYQDQRIAAGIFWKRLADGYPLQSCATIAYILGVDKWRYSQEDTQIDSPYNTYRNVGLPPGPICNPGLSAIKAAIYPQETDYYYFLSKPNGETIFSKTLEEHNHWKAEYLN